ncbi:MAG: microcin ABC transporter permease, partial [Pseudomonadales bacterium]|nr:microcin ABC transporter permease [Pseudomonadales bacterium]
MGRYLLKRLLLIIPTLFGIIAINFVIVQFAPGGPVEQAIAEASGMTMGGATANISAAGAQGPSGSSSYQGSSGLDPEFLAKLEKQFGFDKPAHERFFLMIWNYMRFDFGDSYFQDRPVVDLVIERIPVSISLGLWSLLLIYSISIPLGIAKAVRDGSRFDVATSAVLFAAYAIPGFLFSILLIIIFAGGNYLSWFPLRGLTSEGFE